MRRDVEKILTCSVLFAASALLACGDDSPSTPDASTPDASTPDATIPDDDGGSGVLFPVDCDAVAAQLKSDGLDVDLARWPEIDPVFTPDSAIEDAISDLISKMTLEQKVGQMVMADIGQNYGMDRPDVRPAEVTQYRLGAILNGGNSFPGNEPRSEPQAWVDLAQEFYNASVDPTDVEVAIPYLWGTDAVHGHANIIGATIFPHNIGLGAANDPDLIEQIGQVTAKEIAVTGIELDFSPTVAVARNDQWGRTYESFSEKPEIVAAYSERYVRGLQGTIGDNDWLLGEGRVIATVKHFIGDGGTEGGADQGNNLASEQDLIEIHAAGYPTGLKAGAQVVMASYNKWQGNKVHGEAYLMTCVLRERYNFDGIVLSDWNAHGQVEGCDNKSCPQAILAGVDMFMIPSFDDWPTFISNTIAQVNADEVPEARIDEAVRRILRVKMRAGLLGPLKNKEDPKSRPLVGEFDNLASTEHRAVAREAVRKSLVLLKNKVTNSTPILPLSADLKVLVAGKGANNFSTQSGGWTITWQGTQLTNADFPQAQSILAGIQEKVATGTGAVEFNENAENVQAGAHDVAVVVIGEAAYAEFCGDIVPELGDCTFDQDWQARAKTLEHGLRYPEDRAVIDAIRTADPNLPIVTVLLSGRPLYVNYELNKSHGFVAAWLPGSEGGGVADVLFNDGGADFTGRLSFTWPDAPCQTPLNDGDGQTPRFAYGFGLDYQTADTLGDDLSEATDADCTD